jgi:hypothetical protein
MPIAVRSIDSLMGSTVLGGPTASICDKGLSGLENPGCGQKGQARHLQLDVRHSSAL